MDYRVDRAALRELLTSDSGPVVTHVRGLTRRVENRAKIYVGVDTGRLRGSIQTVILVEGTRVIGRVGSGLPYALFHHEGTGLYGPRRQVIRPRRPGGVLVFRARSGETVFARESRGAPGTHYLVRALRDVSPYPVNSERLT